MRDIKLNAKQQAAVDYLYGPLLVLAGPGTGKTQLLSARVAAILQKTDVGARNILCLTFTESGARNMRERLREMIGDTAYEVTISTYHSFGSEIIKNYAEHFQQIGLERSEDIRMERPIDELTRTQIVGGLIEKLPFDSPLIGARYYIGNIVSTISDLKQNLITPERLRELAKSNLDQIEQAQPILDRIVNDAGGISRKKAEKYAQYASLLDSLSKLDGSLINQAIEDLKSAHAASEEAGSPTSLRAWKDDWLHKDEGDRFTLTDPAKSERMIELARIYERYQSELTKRTAYDFDDMILRAIEGLRNDDELKYNLQERYQFLLLDEFQDTNPSQFELVKRIADHPVHEGRPNIMAVGDDDQAIFAFQGAHVGNMKDFLETFKDVKVINLTDNYRSHPDILHLARNIAEQIEDRLHKSLDDITKELMARSPKLSKTADIARCEFSAEASENAWMANRIKKLIDEGTDPSEIAVLAPRHSILEGLVPFMKRMGIPVAYEKRENILETEIVSGLRLAARLLEACRQGDTELANQYFPLVLGLPYWNKSPEDIWKVNWQAAKYDEKRSWAEIALGVPALKETVLFYLTLSNTAATEPLEITLDKLSGTESVKAHNKTLTAPLRQYYFDQDNRNSDALAYYEAISHLSVIRARLREYQLSSDSRLTLHDFLEFFDMYESAETPLINSHPIAQSNHAVQLMTTYKSKGLEFDYVFLTHAHDDVWGSASRGTTNKLALPPNLRHIRYVNTTEDERRRLLFVAITRARNGLFITSHTNKDNGAATTPLKYLGESDGTSSYLPEHAQKIVSEPSDGMELARDTETLWQAGSIRLPADFRSLLSERLKSYKMSPTHLNTFINLERAGPETWLVGTLLRFPQAPSTSGEYGTAMHNTLEWYQQRTARGTLPNLEETNRQFDVQLERRYLSDDDRDQVRAKGHAALNKFLEARQEMYAQSAKAEVNFYGEGVVLDGAALSGKIDRLEIDEQTKTVRIVDYKTGKPLEKWGRDTKSLIYKQQLYFYRLLVENSGSWKGYTVESARLEFVEADKNGSGSIRPPLYLEFDDKEFAEFKQLITVLWSKMQALDLPDVSGYSKDYKGSTSLIKALLES